MNKSNFLQQQQMEEQKEEDYSDSQSSDEENENLIDYQIIKNQNPQQKKGQINLQQHGQQLQQEEEKIPNSEQTIQTQLMKLPPVARHAFKPKLPLTPHEKTLRIQNYLKSNPANKKESLCRFWMKGVCIFSKEQCHFAHGIEDVVFKKYGQEVGMDFKKLDFDQKPIWQGDRMNFKVTFEIQQFLKELGLVNTVYSLAEINKNKQIRQQIRDILQNQQMKAFYWLLVKEYSEMKGFTASFLEKEYNRVGFIKRGFKYRYNYIYQFLEQECYEVKKKNSQNKQQGDVEITIYPMPKKEQLDQMMKQQIINKCKLLIQQNGLPIQEQLLRSTLYANQVEGELSLHVCLEFYKIKFQDYLKQLLNQDLDFKKQLIEIYIQEFLQKQSQQQQQEQQSQIELDLQNIKIFSFDLDMDLIKKEAAKYLQKKENSIINLEKLEKYLLKNCEKECKQLGTNTKFKLIFRGYLIQQNYLIIKHVLTDYLIMKKSELKKYQMKQFQNYCNCNKIQEQIVQQIQNQPQQQQVIQEEETKKEPQNQLQQTPINLQNYCDKRVILVNDFESLQFACSVLSKHKYIGVDLEGTKKKQKYTVELIELIQLGVQIAPGKSQIFVFDLYEVFATKKNSILFTKINEALKEYLENDKIVKIFHDCRVDSMALHSFLKICPKNVFDTAAVHILITQLNKYNNLMSVQQLNQSSKKQQQQQQPTTEEQQQQQIQKLLKKLEDISLPGLNDILSNYNATNGVNEQKQEMHKKFNSMPREHFHVRPIAQDLLEYSAKDVEDLVEVYFSMKEKLKKTKIIEELQLDDKMMDFWLNKVSMNYVKEGAKSAAKISQNDENKKKDAVVN